MRLINVFFSPSTFMYSDGGALLHLIKSSLGSGILAMPNAFKNGGLIFGLVGTAAIGTLCTHCIYLLVSDVMYRPAFFLSAHLCTASTRLTG
jgi:amino acid permease